MHWIAAGCLLGLVSAVTLMAENPPAANDAAPAPLWFDSIQTPLELSEQDWIQVCRELHATLKSGSLNGATFLHRLPPDSAPRAVILSWGGGQAPARVELGLGKGIRAACANTLQTAFAAGRVDKPANLKIDLVQHVLSVPEFKIREDPIAQPTLVGLTFPNPAAGFTFLPEVLLARDLILMPQKQLKIHVFADDLIGAKEIGKLGYWQAIASNAKPQPVIFFESRSFYSNGTDILPLFRGHRCYFEPLTEAAILDAARRNSEFIVRHHLVGKTAPVTLPFWQVGNNDKELVADQAAAVLALLEFCEIEPESTIFAAAEDGVRQLLKLIEPFTLDPRSSWVTEDYHSTLEANALTALALLKYLSLIKTASFNDHLFKLGLYLQRQVQPDGSLIADRYLPSGNIRPVACSPQEAGVAITALIRLYEKTGNSLFLDKAGQALNYQLDRLSPKGKKAGPALAQVNGWLLVAANDHFTHRRDKAKLPVVEALALQAMNTQTVNPVFPDFAGGWENSAAVNPVANRTMGMAAAARLLADTKRELTAAAALEAAHFGLLFQLQAQHDAASAMYLTQPDLYLGAVRNILTGHELCLRTQAENLLSLTAVLRAARGAQGKTLPLSKEMTTILGKAREQAGLFPRCLPASAPAAAP